MQTEPSRNGRTDMAAILMAAAGVTADRLPGFEDVLEAAAAQLGEAFRPVSPAPIEVELVGTDAKPAAVLSGESIVVTFDAVEWRSEIAVGISRAAIFAMVESMFGGDGKEPRALDGRALSGVETRVAELIAAELAKALHATLPVAAKSLLVPRSGAVPSRDVPPLVEAGSCLVSTFELVLFDKRSELWLAIPNAALGALRRGLRRPAAPSEVVHDSGWSRRIEGEVKRAGVVVRAVLEEPGMTLADIAALKVGQVLPLQGGPDSRVKLESADRNLFWCQLGQGGGAFTVRIESAADEQQEMFDDILPR